MTTQLLGNIREALNQLTQNQAVVVGGDGLLLEWLLRSCGKVRALPEGKTVHAHILKDGGPDDNTLIASLLLRMYSRCGCLIPARVLFESRFRTATPDLPCWNAMIGVYAHTGHQEDALNLFRQMLTHPNDVKPNKFTLTLALSTSASLAEGKHVHALVTALLPNKGDLVVDNALVSMYGRCSSLSHAEAIFERMQTRDVISFTTMITSFVANSYYPHAIAIYRRMLAQGIQPNKVTFLCILNACSNPNMLAVGQEIHTHINSSGFRSHTAVRNALITMYGKCGSLTDAQSTFTETQDRDKISWTAMIGVYAQNGHFEDAFRLFLEMESKGVRPDRITFLSILDACVNLPSIKNIKTIHKYIVAYGYNSDLSVKNALINIYGRHGSLSDARAVFNEIHKRDVISWTTMIGAYVHNGQGKEALDLFYCMEKERHVKPNKLTFIRALDACISALSLKDGRAIHEIAAANGLDSDISVNNSLVHMYAKCGSLNEGRKVFERMLERDVVSWNSMIAAYIQNRQADQALKLLIRMDTEGVKPNSITFLIILNACSDLGALSEARQLHEYIVASGLDLDMVVENTLINMYSKCGSPIDARRVFDRMRRRNVVSWTVMIGAYAQNGHGKEALELFRQMDLEGLEPDKITFLATLEACASLASLENGRAIHKCVISARGMELDTAISNAIINMYSKCGSLAEALSVFVEMPQRDVISWTAIIAAFAQNGCNKEALELFHRMLAECAEPNKVTFLNVLNACNHAGLTEEGLWYFTSMSVEYGIEPGSEHYYSIIDLLGRGGCLVEAEELISNLPFEPDALAWSTLLGACRIHGDVERGAHAAKHAIALDPFDPVPYLLLSNIYAAAGRWDDVARVRKLMEERGVKKQSSCNHVSLHKSHMNHVLFNENQVLEPQLLGIVGLGHVSLQTSHVIDALLNENQMS